MTISSVASDLNLFQVSGLNGAGRSGSSGTPSPTLQAFLQNLLKNASDSMDSEAGQLVNAYA